MFGPLRPPRASQAPPGALAAHPSPRPPSGSRHGGPQELRLPARPGAHGQVGAGEQGRDTRSRSSRCRGSEPSRSRRCAWRSGRGACPRAHGGLGSAPPRARPTGPAVRPRAWRGPSRRASRPRGGAGRTRPRPSWRRRASPRWRDRGRRRRPSPGGTSCRGATGCPSRPGASRGRASPTRPRAGLAPPRS